MELNPQDLEAAQIYKLMIGVIVPRPIAFVSTISPAPGSATNLAPFSFFTGVGSDPMTVLFCPANKADGSEKDTLRNAKPRDEGGTGQFVVNLAVESYARQVAAAAESLDYGESEFDLTGLTTSPSLMVAPPRVADSPVAFECETMQVIRLTPGYPGNPGNPGNPGAPGGPNIVIGRVVHIHARDDVINERFHIDPTELAAIGRMGGLSYCRTADRFDMPFGRKALEED